MVALIAACSLRLHGQPARDPDEVLAQVRAKLRAMAQRMPRYTCVQTVERKYYKLGEHKGSPPSCDQIAGDRKTGRSKLQLYATDRLRRLAERRRLTARVINRLTLSQGHADLRKRGHILCGVGL